MQLLIAEIAAQAIEEHDAVVGVVAVGLDSSHILSTEQAKCLLPVLRGEQPEDSPDELVNAQIIGRNAVKVSILDGEGGTDYVITW